MAVRRPTYEVALDRFVRGQCPLCGKGKGEPKGVEKRENMGDIFCHSCRREWTNTTVLRLKHELSRNGNVPLGIAFSPLDPPSRVIQFPSLFQRFFKRIAALVGK